MKFWDRKYSKDVYRFLIQDSFALVGSSEGGLKKIILITSNNVEV